MIGNMDQFRRPNSEQLTDLHLYLVLPELWRAHQQSALNQIIDDTISLGFIRVHPEATINSIRREIEDNEVTDLPQDYVFLKCVGRCLTQVKSKQEYTLKVKSFQPPKSYASEIFILDSVAANVRNTPFSGTSSHSSARHTGTPRSDRSEFSGHKPIPPIGQNGHSSGNPHNTQANKPGNKQTQNILKNDFDPLQHKATQYSQPPTPYLEHVDARNPNAPNFADRFEQVDSDSDSSLQRHVVFESPLPLNPKERSLSPISATPTNSPPPVTFHRPPENTRAADENFPPLSATPPYSTDPDTKHPRPEPSNQSPRRNSITDDTKGQSRKGSKAGDPTARNGGLSEEEKKHLEELLSKQKQTEEEEARARAEVERKRAQYEEEQEKLRKQREDAKKRELEEKRKQEEKQRLLDEERDQEERERIEREEQERIEEQKRREIEEERRLEEIRRLQDEDDEAEKKRKREEDLARLRKQQAEEDLMREEDEEENTDSRSAAGSPLVRSASDLKRELDELRQSRLDAERNREELVKKARLLQTKTQQRRNQARDVWKKRYFEEKKKTGPLEDQCNKLRSELEMLHRKIMSQLETTKDPARRTGDNKPSQQTPNNLKIQAARLQHEMDDLQHRVENIKMKLTTEMKLRNQAEGELKALRAELTQKKINMTLTHRSQAQPAFSHTSTTPGLMATPRS